MGRYKKNKDPKAEAAHRSAQAANAFKGKKGQGAGEPPPLPKVDFEDFAEADQTFRDLFDAFSPSSSGDFVASTPARPKEQPLSFEDELLRSEQTRRSSGPGASTLEIDLHRLTLAEAKSKLDREISAAMAYGRGNSISLKIITGKGIHSGPGGGVLASEVHRYVRQVYGLNIVSIEDSPAEVRIGGLPLRGHFHVTLRRK